MDNENYYNNIYKNQYLLDKVLFINECEEI